MDTKIDIRSVSKIDALLFLTPKHEPNQNLKIITRGRSWHSGMSSSVALKWGIPLSSDGASETSVLERIVWVQYDDIWWPAILYKSYLELQQHLYAQFNSYEVKAQFAFAIMREMQEDRVVPIARLLGKTSLEIMEVDIDSYREFYWYLGDILPEVCDTKRYGGQLKLYLELHCALDEVESIFLELTDACIALSSRAHGTWLELAEMTLQSTEFDSSLDIFRGSKGAERSKQKDSHKCKHSNEARQISSRDTRKHLPLPERDEWPPPVQQAELWTSEDHCSPQAADSTKSKYSQRETGKLSSNTGHGASKTVRPTKPTPEMVPLRSHRTSTASVATDIPDLPESSSSGDETRKFSNRRPDPKAKSHRSRSQRTKNASRSGGRGRDPSPSKKSRSHRAAE